MSNPAGSSRGRSQSNIAGSTAAGSLSHLVSSQSHNVESSHNAGAQKRPCTLAGMSAGSKRHCGGRSAASEDSYEVLAWEDWCDPDALSERNRITGAAPTSPDDDYQWNAKVAGKSSDEDYPSKAELAAYSSPSPELIHGPRLLHGPRWMAQCAAPLSFPVAPPSPVAARTVEQLEPLPRRRRSRGPCRSQGKRRRHRRRGRHRRRPAQPEAEVQ